jgi:hypothetical protein
MLICSAIIYILSKWKRLSSTYGSVSYTCGSCGWMKIHGSLFTIRVTEYFVVDLLQFKLRTEHARSYWTGVVTKRGLVDVPWDMYLWWTTTNPIHSYRLVALDESQVSRWASPAYCYDHGPEWDIIYVVVCYLWSFEQTFFSFYGQWCTFLCS